MKIAIIQKSKESVDSFLPIGNYKHGHQRHYLNRCI